MNYKGVLKQAGQIRSLQEQEIQINEYAKENNLTIKEYICIDNQNILLNLSKNDICIATHPLALGGSIIKILDVLNILHKNSINVCFIQHKELSTMTSNSLFLCSVFENISTIQKDIISHRTKLGLQATKQKGVKLGRPKGIKNKTRVLDEYREYILQYLNNGVSTNKILTNINAKKNTKLSYPSMKYFIENDNELKKARDNFKSGSLLG